MCVNRVGWWLLGVALLLQCLCVRTAHTLPCVEGDAGYRQHVCVRMRLAVPGGAYCRCFKASSGSGRNRSISSTAVPLHLEA